MFGRYTKAEVLSEEQKRNNEPVELRMQVELRRDLLSEAVAACICSAFSRSLLGGRYHLYSYSKRNGVSVCRAGSVRENGVGLPDRRRYDLFAGDGYRSGCLQKKRRSPMDRSSAATKGHDTHPKHILT